MGISSKTSSSSQQSTSTTTPNVPQWGVDSLQGLNTSIDKIAATDPSSFVVGADPNQTMAATGAANLGSTWQPSNAAASTLATKVGDATAPTATAAGIFDNGIAQYLNPETQNVVNTTLADFDQNAGQTRAAQAAKGALAGAFGGSRWGLQEGETEGQLSRARATTDASLRSTAYNDATALANEDANRRQSTSSQNANLADTNLSRQGTIAGLLNTIGNSADANATSDINTQGATGATMRGIAADKATAPISLAQTVAALLGQNQLPLLTGATTNSSGTSTGTQNPSTIGAIGEGIQTAAKLAALFSDRRLKRDIVKLGEREDGLGVYRFRYLWSPIRHIGVMAQEVLKVKPQAVSVHASGFLMVDYGAL